MSGPRITPGRRADLGLVNTAITRVLGIAAKTNPPNLFTTLGRHRGLFRRWLMFAGALMPGGKLPRRDTEILILRVAHLNDCAYEWAHHERLGRRAGLSREEIARVREGSAAAGWSDQDSALLDAADELHGPREIGDATWARLQAIYDERQLIEICLVVGHYEMLAMTINTIGIETDVHRGK
jgi:AhpD family alkylhydroperoxidase